MFDQLFKRPAVIARHAHAPYAEDRVRYLSHCRDRGDARQTLLLKAEELLWIARRLKATADRCVTVHDLQAIAGASWRDRERTCGRKLRLPRVRGDFVRVARAWLAYLGRLHRPTEIIPFQKYLDAYSSWATNDRGLSDTTVDSVRGYIKEFLRWYSALGRPLSDVRVTDIDVYLAQGAARGWQRISVCNIAGVLRRFFRFTGQRKWTSSTLADAIQGPRIYAYEGIPQAPSWADVRRLLATLDPNRPADIRDRAVLMLFAIYGLRASEVAKLRLAHLDWDRDLLHVHRLKQRRTQTYPLLPSVGNALIKYLKEVRRPSAHREVFQTLHSPYCPMSRAASYYVVATRLEALGVRSKNRGPHCLRHACATHLLADGLSFKEIGDHLGHRSSAATRIYAKVDMRGLREVAAFDLGELS